MTCLRTDRGIVAYVSGLFAALTLGALLFASPGYATDRAELDATIAKVEAILTAAENSMATIEGIIEIKDAELLDLDNQLTAATSASLRDALQTRIEKLSETLDAAEAERDRIASEVARVRAALDELRAITPTPTQ